MLYFGYINKEGQTFLTALSSGWEVRFLKKQKYVETFIDIFKAKNMKEAYKKLGVKK